MTEIKTISWDGDKVILVDQTKLPLEEENIECSSWEEVAEAIKTMKIRGAPAIGVAAALGIALGAKNSQATATSDFIVEVERVATEFFSTRPTARNLFWAIERMKDKVYENKDHSVGELKMFLEKEAVRILEEDIEINKRMGRWGAELIKDGDSILTHCNAGALATAGYGTALGVIRAAFSQGKKISVFVDETRPLLQGARLTAWELKREGIPFTLITDNMAGYFMGRRKVSKVIVGADRIALNGDVANKIGTYTVAVLAKENEIPFYVAAPLSTVDFSLATGKEIPIEERNPEEVTHFLKQQIAPDNVSVFNPAFDITPFRYVAGIITERGVAKSPFQKELEKLQEKERV